MKIPKDMNSGTVYESKNYGPFLVVQYRKFKDVTVRFIDTGTEVITHASCVRSRKVKDKFMPKTYGVGFIGDGEYMTGTTNTPNMAHRKWSKMLQRCYSEKYQDINPSYIGVTVCKEWHNFQNFSRWFEENYIFDGGVWHLDKDIKIKGNRVYSPESCLFVSREENHAYMIKERLFDRWFISPKDVLTKVVNVLQFCKERVLSDSHMCQVYNGKRNSHKGWTKA